MSHLCDATGCKLFESQHLSNRLLLVWGEDEISEQRNVKVYPYDIVEKNQIYKFVAYGFALIGVICLAILLLIGISATDKIIVPDMAIEVLAFGLMLSALITAFFDNKSLT